MHAAFSRGMYLTVSKSGCQETLRKYYRHVAGERRSRAFVTGVVNRRIPFGEAGEATIGMAPVIRGARSTAVRLTRDFSAHRNGISLGLFAV
jgi:hypothetical protein